MLFESLSRQSAENRRWIVFNFKRKFRQFSERADAFASEVIVQFPGKANETLLLFCSGEVNRQKVVIMVDLNS